MKLSVVIPILNESANTFFWSNLQLLTSQKQIEIIVVDGGSVDDTLLKLQNYPIKLCVVSTTSRAVRLNVGMQAATAELILLLHPRTLISDEVIQYLLANVATLKWGGFLHSFDQKHLLLQFTSWYSNFVRAKFAGIVYLDHCIYLRRDYFVQVGDIPPVDIFEDTLLSKMLMGIAGKPKVIPLPVRTSAIRFMKNGVFKQAYINQVLKVQYYLGKNHRQMNELYEKNTALNSIYKNDK